MTVYFATVLPGLEAVLVDEIKGKLSATDIEQTKRGKVFFASTNSVKGLKELRTADNLFQFVAQFEIGPHKRDLTQLQEYMTHIDIDFINKRGSFRVNASRKGNHTYTRFEAANAAMVGIAKRYPNWEIGAAGLQQTEFRLDIENNEALLSLRLTDATFRYRQSQRQFSRAALLPTVAHALVWLSSPHPEDIFVDPCCGSGTILAERINYPVKRIMGGDISEENATVTKENLEYNVKVEVWDAGNLPLADNYANKVVTNLPFGRQVSSHEDIQLLYGTVLKELSRIMKTNGRAIILARETN